MVPKGTMAVCGLRPALESWERRGNRDVQGVIRRVKRCKRVVVELDGIASVAIALVPAALLKEV